MTTLKVMKVLKMHNSLLPSNGDTETFMSYFNVESTLTDQNAFETHFAFVLTFSVLSVHFSFTLYICNCVYI